MWTNREVEECLRLFMSAESLDGLEAMLVSVPDGNWWTVWARLQTSMHEEEGKLLPPVSAVVKGKPLVSWQPSAEDFIRFDLLQGKKSLLNDQRRRREQFHR